MKRNVARWIWCVVCRMSHVAHLLVLGNTVLQGLDLACRRALVLRLDLLGDLSLRLPLDCHEELKLGVGEETEHVQRRIDLDLCAEWHSSDAQRHSRQRWDGTQGTRLTRATIQPPKSEPLTSTLNMSKPISIAAETWKPKTLTAAAAESLGGDASCLYLHRPSQARHLRKEAYSAVLLARLPRLGDFAEVDGQRKARTVLPVRHRLCDRKRATRDDDRRELNVDGEGLQRHKRDVCRNPVPANNRRSSPPTLVEMQKA